MKDHTTLKKDFSAKFMREEIAPVYRIGTNEKMPLKLRIEALDFINDYIDDLIKHLNESEAK